MIATRRRSTAEVAADLFTPGFAHTLRRQWHLTFRASTLCRAHGLADDTIFVRRTHGHFLSGRRTMKNDYQLQGLRTAWSEHCFFCAKTLAHISLSRCASGVLARVMRSCFANGKLLDEEVHSLFLCWWFSHQSYLDSFPAVAFLV